MVLLLKTNGGEIIRNTNLCCLNICFTIVVSRNLSALDVPSAIGCLTTMDHQRMSYVTGIKCEGAYGVGGIVLRGIIVCGGVGGGGMCRFEKKLMKTQQI